MDLGLILFFRRRVGEFGFLPPWVLAICRMTSFVQSVPYRAQSPAWHRTPPETFGLQTSMPLSSNCVTKPWCNRLPGPTLDTKILQARWWLILRGVVYGLDSTRAALLISQTIKCANRTPPPMDLRKAVSIICVSIVTVRFGRLPMVV